MNALNNLKTYLLLKGTVGINEVLVDSFEIINTDLAITYPLVWWDLGTIKFTEDTRANQRSFSIKCYVVQKWVASETNALTKIQTWDDIHTKFVAYLNYLDSIRSAHNFVITNLASITGEYYDRGMISVNEEIGIGYEIKFNAYC